MHRTWQKFICVYDKKWIGSRAELHLRRIKPGVFCVVCGREETIYHGFWVCHYSMQFWDLLRSKKGVSVATPPIMMDSQSAMSYWLLGWFAGATEDEWAPMIHTTYGLWLTRNETRDDKRIATPQEMIARVTICMEEWRAA